MKIVNASNNKQVIVVSHIAFRNVSPYDRLEGPYSSVCQAFNTLDKEVAALLLPLNGFLKPIFFGPWQKEKKIKIPGFLGRVSFLKYLLDLLIIVIYLIKSARIYPLKKTLIIGIDPLCALPLVLFKKIFNYDVIFYSVDFNEKRFANKILQYLYELSDELSSKWAAQVWTVCESLKDYKKTRYGVKTFYIPNSSIFTDKFYIDGKNKRTGDKMAWTGSCITERQFEILFKTIKQIQQIKPDLKLYFAPTGNNDKFKENCEKYQLKKWQVLNLKSRRQWQQFASTCDVGIAIYDDRFGSTKYIEPLKIWDFMLCGLPFVISCEPSIATAVKKSGVAYLLEPGNKIPKDSSLKNFLQPENLKKLQPECLALAKKFDIQKQILEAIGIS